MALPHAQPGEVVDVQPLGAELVNTPTRTLLKTDTLELLRLVLPAGKEIAEHQAPGEITVHCVEGRVEFAALGSTIELRAGQLLFLPAREPHAVRAVEDSSILLTLLLPGPKA